MRRYKMPLLYLAKVNLNSNIFDVYNKSLSIETVLDTIYRNFNTGDEFSRHSKEHYIDALGNTTEFLKESKYSFQEIQKLMEGKITGKLVRNFTKPSEKLNEVNGKMVPTTVQETVSIYFYYDVYNEMITFCERQSFGYNQFMGAFAYLLNNIAFPYEFEIFLQKDRDLLEEKLKTLVRVQQVKATLIPPNSNDDDLNELRNDLIYMQQCQEANAVRVELLYSSNNLNMESKVMKDIKTAASRGYGDINAIGINQNGRKQVIRSSQDAAYTVSIQENIKEKDFNEESHNMIHRFLDKIAMAISRRKGEPNAQ